MSALYFDLSSGVAGDMLLASLLDSILSLDELNLEIKKLNLTGVSLKHSKTKRSSIEVSRFEVLDLNIKASHSHSHDHHDDHAHDHGHEHSHKHDHHHDHHGHTHDHEHGEDHHHHHKSGGHSHSEHRNLHSIRKIVEESKLSLSVKNNAMKVFSKIAEVEAKAHGVTIEEIHFHEVGAIDSIVDVVGFCIALDLLKIDEVYFNAFRFGNGFVKCAHGKMPLPVPAVAALTKGFASCQTDVPSELTTPTGAALLTVLGKQVERIPEGKILAVGYGTGSREPKDIFGALRVLHIEERKGASQSDILEAIVNLDDMTGEAIGFLSEKLLETFKQDVWLEPIQMKKNRSAVSVHVLLQKSELETLKQLLFIHSSTFGFRYHEFSKEVYDREIKSFQSSLGECRIKIGTFNDLKKYSPEYEDCKKISINTGLPLSEVLQIIRSEYLSK